MITEQQIETLKEWEMIKSLGIDDIIYKPMCLTEDRSPYIYFCYDKNNVLIYIGKTQNISSRIRHHEELLTEWKGHEWWAEVEHIMHAETPSFESLSDYERMYIKRYLPKYNKCIYKNTPLLELPELKFKKYEAKEYSVEEIMLKNEKDKKIKNKLWNKVLLLCSKIFG